MATHEAPPPVELDEVTDGYEKRDVNLLSITVLALACVALVAIFSVALNDFFLMTRDRMIEQEVLGKPSPTLVELRQEETEQLTTYGTVADREGVYRIPIERAIDLMVEQNTNSAE